MLIVASSRLPVYVETKKSEIYIRPSVGGLASGMQSVYKDYGAAWVGWLGVRMLG